MGNPPSIQPLSSRSYLNSRRTPSCLAGLPTNRWLAALGGDLRFRKTSRIEPCSFAASLWLLPSPLASFVGLLGCLRLTWEVAGHLQRNPGARRAHSNSDQGVNQTKE